MKKSLIAGAGVAALAMAFVPFGLASATDITSMEDTLTITVEPTCSFDAASHSYSATMTANDLNTNVGTTTMTIICNQYNGYAVTANMTSLSGNGSNAISYSATTPTAGSGTWTAYNTPTVAGTAGTAANIAATADAAVISNSVHTSSTGDSSVIVYKVGTTNNQAAGAYTGTATYTLTANS